MKVASEIAQALFQLATLPYRSIILYSRLGIDKSEEGTVLKLSTTTKVKAKCIGAVVLCYTISLSIAAVTVPNSHDFYKSVVTVYFASIFVISCLLIASKRMMFDFSVSEQSIRPLSIEQIGSIVSMVIEVIQMTALMIGNSTLHRIFLWTGVDYKISNLSVSHDDGDGIILYSIGVMVFMCAMLIRLLTTGESLTMPESWLPTSNDRKVTRHESVLVLVLQSSSMTKVFLITLMTVLGNPFLIVVLSACGRQPVGMGQTIFVCLALIFISYFSFYFFLFHPIVSLHNTPPASTLDRAVRFLILFIAVLFNSTPQIYLPFAFVSIIVLLLSSIVGTSGKIPFKGIYSPPRLNTFATACNLMLLWSCLCVSGWECSNSTSDELYKLLTLIAFGWIGITFAIIYSIYSFNSGNATVETASSEKNCKSENRTENDNDDFDNLSPSPVKSPMKIHKSIEKEGIPVCNMVVDLSQSISKENSSMVLEHCQTAKSLLAGIPTVSSLVSLPTGKQLKICNSPPNKDLASIATTSENNENAHLQTVWNATDEEDETEYCEGGYHRVFLSDVYKSDKHNYTIQSKLGWGQFSTVWLASTNTNSESTSFHALKIVKSWCDVSRAAQSEIELLEHINKKISERESNLSVPLVNMTDTFTISGHHGTHTVIAMTLCGPNLLKLVTNLKFKGVNHNIVKHITTEILQALQFLHDEVGVVHTDLKLENVLLQVHSSETLRILAMACGGNIISSDVELSDASLNGMWIRRPNETLKESIKRSFSIKLSDLGGARYTNRSYPVCVLQTREYRSPEVIIGWSDITGKADMWSMACVVFELLAGEFLFDPKDQTNFDRDVYHIALFRELLGEMPEDMTTGTGRFIDLFYNSDGIFRHVNLEHVPLSSRIVVCCNFTPEAAEVTASFLLTMLEYHPESRISAAEALKESWLEISEDDESCVSYYATDEASAASPNKITTGL